MFVVNSFVIQSLALNAFLVISYNIFIRTPTKNFHFSLLPKSPSYSLLMKMVSGNVILFFIANFIFFILFSKRTENASFRPQLLTEIQKIIVNFLKI